MKTRDANNKSITLGDHVRVPDGEVERVIGFTDDGTSVVHGAGGWITPAKAVVRV